MITLGAIRQDPDDETAWDRRNTMRWIVERVGFALAISPTLIMSKRKDRRCVRPRWVAFYLLHESYGYSLPQIGRFFGKDHTTILHGVQQLIRLRDEGDAVARHQIHVACSAIGVETPAGDHEAISDTMVLPSTVVKLPSWVTAPRQPEDPNPTTEELETRRTKLDRFWRDQRLTPPPAKTMVKRNCLTCGVEFRTPEDYRMCPNCRLWARDNGHLEGVEL